MNRLLPAALGVLALAVAASALGAPPDALATLGRDSLVVGVAVAAAAVGLASLRSESSSAVDGLPEPPDGDDDATRVGDEIDRALDRPGIGGTSTSRGRRLRRRRRARNAVREVAIATLAERHGVADVEAAALVRDGTWTDDPRAAACLAEDVAVPLRLRLEDWLRGERDRRRLEAAVAEIDALADGAAGGER